MKDETKCPECGHSLVVLQEGVTKENFTHLKVVGSHLLLTLSREK